MKNKLQTPTIFFRPSLLLAAALCFCSTQAPAETIITIQPHTNGLGYVVTYSWKGTFAAGMDSASNGSNAYLDNLTTSVSSDYLMPSGNHVGGKIRYSQHNNNGINGDFALVPALGANPVHFDGTDGESLTPGEPMAESSHANIGFTETTSSSPDWYNNSNDYGGVRSFGSGVQGSASLTSWNGIDSSSAYGNVQFEGQNLLGQGMQFGVNGSTPGLADSGRLGMVGDAKYWNDLNTAGNNNGLLIGYFPYATTFPNTATPADKFIDQFHVGTYTAGTDITLYIVNDSNHVPVLVEEISAVTYASWSGGAVAGEDANDDGVKNAVAWALGAADTNENAIGLLPTLDNSTDPDFFIFNFNRSDDANADDSTTITVEYGSTLSDDWITAVAGADVVITETDGSPTDAVEVKIRRTLAVGDKLFARLKVVVTP